MSDTPTPPSETPPGERPVCPAPVCPAPVCPAPVCPAPVSPAPLCPDPAKHLEYKPVCLMAILYCALGASAILVALAVFVAAMSAFRR